jgi:4-amino-4-deoxy-L-arabinose transferase-like glycosyltransferase
MADVDAQVLLRDVEHLRQRARRDRHAASAPLLLAGVVTVGGAPLADTTPLAWGWPGGWYWPVALPVAVLLLAWWYRRQRDHTGVGPRFGRLVAALAALAVALVVALPFAVFYLFVILAVTLLIAGAVRRSWRQASAGLAVLVLSPVSGFLMLPASIPLFVVGLGLLALGVWQRDGFLAGAAVACAVLAVLDRFLVLGNALDRLGVPEGAPVEVVTQAALGLLLIAAGVVAWRREAGAA